MNPAVDTQRLAFILNQLRLPAIKQAWLQFAERADKEAWPATRFLAALAEHEIAERDRNIGAAPRLFDALGSEQGGGHDGSLSVVRRLERGATLLRSDRDAQSLLSGGGRVRYMRRHA